ncbi:hypothetical protein MJO28_004185, partial [Puccinia striiformis f. sp. tritici]
TNYIFEVQPSATALEFLELASYNGSDYCQDLVDNSTPDRWVKRSKADDAPYRRRSASPNPPLNTSECDGWERNLSTVSPHQRSHCQGFKLRCVLPTPAVAFRDDHGSLAHLSFHRLYRVGTQPRSISNRPYQPTTSYLLLVPRSTREKPIAISKYLSRRHSLGNSVSRPEQILGAFHEALPPMARNHPKTRGPLCDEGTTFILKVTEELSVHSSGEGLVSTPCKKLQDLKSSNTDFGQWDPPQPEDILIVSARIKTRMRRPNEIKHINDRIKVSSSNEAGTSTKNHWLVIAHTSRSKTLIKRVGVLDQSKAITAD